MNILGIDPSPDGKHSCVMGLAGYPGTFVPNTIPPYKIKVYKYSGSGYNELPSIIIIENPVPQGDRCKFKSYTALCKEYGKLLAELQRLYPEARIFAVSANVIRAQAGYITAYGKADPYIKHILQMQGYKCGNGELFGNSVDEKGRIIKPPDGTHKRDALMCALWSWKDPRNAEYEVRHG